MFCFPAGFRRGALTTATAAAALSSSVCAAALSFSPLLAATAAAALLARTLLCLGLVLFLRFGSRHRRNFAQNRGGGREGLLLLPGRPHPGVPHPRVPAFSIHGRLQSGCESSITGTEARVEAGRTSAVALSLSLQV